MRTKFPSVEKKNIYFRVSLNERWSGNPADEQLDLGQKQGLSRQYLTIYTSSFRQYLHKTSKSERPSDRVAKFISDTIPYNNFFSNFLGRDAYSPIYNAAKKSKFIFIGFLKEVGNPIPQVLIYPTCIYKSY